MKHTFYFIAALLLLSSGYPAKADSGDEALAKHALQTISIAYECFNSTNSEYIEPKEYIIDAATKKITGQYFFNAVGKDQYARIDLNYDEAGNIVTADFRVRSNNHKVTLVWQGNKLSSLEISGLSYANFSFLYNQNGVPLEVLSLIPFNKMKIFYMPEYNGMQLIKISTAREKKSNIHAIKTYEYKSNEIIVTYFQYTVGQPVKPETLKGTYATTYRKTADPDTYVILQNGEVSEQTYKDKLLVIQKTTKKGISELRTYTYINGEVFKEDKVTSNEAGFIEHSVLLQFSLTDQPETVPEYEKTSGFYKFSESGELIYESRKGKFREKKDGVWSDWQIK